MLQLKLTSRFHVGCSIVYELLDLLGHDLGTVPCRLVFGLHGHRRWKKALGLSLRLFFGRSGTLAPEAGEERHCGTERVLHRPACASGAVQDQKSKIAGSCKNINWRSGRYEVAF